MTSPIVDIHDLEFRWTPEQPLLRIPRLTIEAGERVFLHGPSGSGKSSFLSVLAGVATPRGCARILGIEIATLTARQRDTFRADHFGIIFQMFNLVPYLSIVENVTLPCRFSARRNARTQKHGGPENDARRLLEHLDLSADDGRSTRAVGQLSVGQQQRVAAARALIGQPEIILADEPTSALDIDRREAFLRLLFRECEAEGATLIFVSHDRSLERLFGRSLALSEINQTSSRSNH